MFNQKQISRLDHPDHKLIELSEDDFRDFNFKEYIGKNKNKVFSRYNYYTNQTIGFEHINGSSFKTTIDNNVIIISRWWELVMFWYEQTHTSIFYS